MQTIAGQVSDRDATVRTAALDVVVAVYNIVGEDVYKLMGAIGAKVSSAFSSHHYIIC